MARFSLRNQEKIANVLGPKVLARILIALNRHFQENKEIKSSLIEGDKFETIIIKDVGEGTNLIAFYIIKHTFNAYNLALKEIIK